MHLTALPFPHTGKTDTRRKGIFLLLSSMQVSLPMKKAKQNNARPSLYGFHAVREAWLNPARKIHALYITDQAAKGFAPVLSEAQSLDRPEPTQIDKSALDKMLPKGAVHQGLALETEPLENAFIQDLIIGTKDKDQAVLLMLDQVTDPHNVGAILRSACALVAPMA